MHCPSCGKSTTGDQQYCRACGMNLKTVGELVAAHTSSDEGKMQKVNADKAALARLVKWMSWGLLIIGLGVLLLIIGKTFVMDRLVGLLASVLLLAGTGIAGWGVLGSLRDAAYGGAKSLKPGTLPVAGDTRSLPEERIPVPPPSLTEHTTRSIAERRVRNTGE